MTLRKRFIVKLLGAIAILLVAALFTTIIYGYLAQQNPTDAIPELTVVYDGTPLSQDVIMISSYDWWFFYTTKSEVLQQPDSWMELSPIPVLGGRPLLLDFAKPPGDIKISRAEEGSRSFVEISGSLSTPTTPGIYTYRVEAWWGYMGSAQFYFSIRVVTPEEE